MRTGELDRKERMEVLLWNKNAVIYGAGGSFDSIVPNLTKNSTRRINIHDWKETQ